MTTHPSNNQNLYLKGEALEGTRLYTMLIPAQHSLILQNVGAVH
jgi:hypothetical protein